MRKLEKEELIYFSALITELKKLHQEVMDKDQEVDPYTFISISDNLERAVSNYKMELLIFQR